MLFLLPPFSPLPFENSPLLWWSGRWPGGVKFVHYFFTLFFSFPSRPGRIGGRFFFFPAGKEASFFLFPPFPFLSVSGKGIGPLVFSSRFLSWSRKRHLPSLLLLFPPRAVKVVMCFFSLSAGCKPLARRASTGFRRRLVAVPRVASSSSPPPSSRTE